MEHFIFPIGDNGQWLFKENGPVANHANFLNLVSTDVDVSWKISNGFKIISEGDLVWGYLTTPRMQIRALGVVRPDISGAPRIKQYSLPIRWISEATRQLKADPINFYDYRQKVQGAVVRANPGTQEVLEQWLDTHPISGLQP